MNVVDEYSNPKGYFQAVYKAIFDTREYKKNIFKNNLKMKDYVFFLNKEFDTTINPNAMSKGVKHEIAVEEYFIKNFTLN